MKHLIPLIFYLSSISFLYGVDYTFFDGNGNRFELKKSKLVTLTYDPITPIQSSSGVYSGGEKKVVILTKAEYDEFLQVVTKAKQARKPEQVEMLKGTSSLFWFKHGKKNQLRLPYQNEDAQRIEGCFRKFLGDTNSTAKQGKMVNQKFVITRNLSPWLGLTSTSEEEEKGKHVRARSFPLSGYEGISNPKEIVWKQEPLLQRNEKLKEVAVDSRYFSDLERIDLTRLEKGKTVMVGAVMLPELIDSDFIIPFLLYGQILISYWHTDAVMEMRSESTAESKKCYSFVGEHHYFTNEKNTEHFRFRICLDTKTMKISVIGD